jgi:hypothetical protein
MLGEAILHAAAWGTFLLSEALITPHCHLYDDAIMQCLLFYAYSPTALMFDAGEPLFGKIHI